MSLARIYADSKHRLAARVARGQLAVLAARSESLQAQLDGALQSAATRERERDDEQLRSGGLEACLQEVRERGARLASDLEEEKRARTLLESELRAAREQIATLEAQAVQDVQTTASLEAQLGAAHARAAGAEVQVQQERQASVSLASQLESAQQRIASLEQDVQSGQQALASMGAQVHGASRHAARLEARAHEQGARLAALERELETAAHALRHWQVQWTALAAEHWGAPPAPRAHRRLSAGQRAELSLEGRIPIDEPSGGAQPAPLQPLIYGEQAVDSCLEQIRAGARSEHGTTDDWLREALARHPIESRSVVVIGSRTPWYEATCLHFGARPTTLERAHILVRSPRLEVLHPEDLESAPRTFDAALAVASIEREGLGADGEALAANGDLRAMERAKKLVAPGGLFFLAVRIGADRLRLHDCRVYGRLRLPLLLRGWTQIDAFGLAAGSLDSEPGDRPLLVLRND